MDKIMPKIEKIITDAIKATEKEMIAKLKALKTEAENKEAKAVIQLCIDTLKEEKTEDE